MKITVLSFFDRISLFHSLTPFLFSKHRRMFHYTRNAQYCLKQDRNRILFMDRWFQKPPVVDIPLLRRLRDKYKTIFFFNGTAGGGLRRPEVLPFIDFFFNKSLYKDRALYTKPLYCDELYTDYYHTKDNICDPKAKTDVAIHDTTLTERLRVSWNIGIGDFPKQKYRQQVGVFLARMFGAKFILPFHKTKNIPDSFPENNGTFDIHARWGGPHKPVFRYHRNIMLEKIRRHPRFLTGKVPQRQYNNELKNSKITLSPFGWGEICFRDFEAVLNGSLLLKPDVGHLETWPDIFVPYETYVPFSWDGSDLVKKGEYYLAHAGERKRIAENAFQSYREQVNALDDRLESILSLIKN